MPALASWLTDRLPDLLASPLAARLGWTCLHSLWQGLAIAAVLAIALRLVPRRSSAATNARYLLATAALVALPVAAAATFASVEPGVNPAAAEATSDAASATASRFARDGAARPASVPQSPTIVLLPHLATAAARPAARASFATAAATAALDHLRPWLPAIAGVWLAGALLAAGRMTCGYWLTRRMVARGEPLAHGRFQASVERWRGALGIDAAVRVLASAAVEATVVVGWLKPVILWPAAALLGLPAHELDALVVHELAHVRRQDALMNLLQACIDVLFFHHPAAWWISGQVRAEREHCADDLAVRVLEAGHAGSRLSYAKALLALEERRQAHALALAANGGSLLDRIRRLAGVEEQPASPVRPLAAAAMASLLLAVLVTAAAPIREARADELPKDTNTIESLTVEQAKKLVEEFPGVTVEFTTKGFGPYKVGNCLPLNSLKNLAPDVAQALAGYSKGPLILNGLTAIDAETAKALAEFKGQMLDLSGLTALDADTAKALAGFKGFVLQLDGLASLSGDVAAAIVGSQRPKRLSFNGLKSLDVKTAKTLAESTGDLSLNGLTTLDADTAKALAGFKGQVLYLSGLTAFDADTAKALTGFKGVLCISGLTARNAETTKALAGFKGQSLTLVNLTTLDAAAAEVIAQTACFILRMNDLGSVDVDTAKALAKFKGQLHLDGLTAIDATKAKALANREGGILSLAGLTTLDVESAEALAASKSWDGRLPDLTKIDDASANAIAQSKAWMGHISDLTMLTPATMRVLAAYKGDQLPLFSLNTLDADSAKRLADFKGSQLNLGVPALDAATASALAGYKGRILSLDRLTTLDAQAAKAIADFSGQVLFFNGLATLDADTTKHLAESRAENLFLGGVTVLNSPDSVAIAKALATRKGPLSLPNLKKLSPQTLSALLEKEDIEIPLIETLELIPEPDGSPTEDFVIPEGFQQQQKR
jgi:beta-lactamase regulating signal transducer with metallopeptidase domain/ubiquinone biosynthesis protein UbiJ